MFALLRQPNFARLWVGQLISMLGDWVLFIALPFYVYELTGSALTTGLMFMIGLLPGLLFGSVAGVFVDRWDRRRLMIAADLLRAVTLLALLWVRSVEWLWLVYAVALVQAVVSQFFFPAKSAIIPRLVGQQDLMAANSLNGLSDSLTRLIGPTIGGVLMAMFGLTSVVLVDSASFLFSALMIYWIADTRTASLSEVEGANLASSEPVSRAGGPAHLLSDWLEGLRLIKSQRLLSALLSISSVIAFADGIFTALIVVFVKEVVHAGTIELGWMMAAQGVGGLLGGLTMGFIRRQFQPSRVVIASCFADGALLLAIFNAGQLGLILALFVIAGVMIIALNVSSQTLLQEATADQFRGRVFGALSTVGALARLGGLILAGALADLVGPLPILDVGGLLWLVAGVMAVWLLPAPALQAVANNTAELGIPEPSGQAVGV
ncbi:MAG: MFS transporter [Chloroflexi bacterium]|nr:MFS transporter [Chloroflexota bacterium]